MNDADNDSGTNTGKARERVVLKQNLDLPLDLKILADPEPISGVLTRAYIAALLNLARSFRSKGEPLHRIALRLNRMGEFDRDGAPWRAASVRSFIDSPVSGSSVSDAVNSGTGR